MVTAVDRIQGLSGSLAVKAPCRTMTIAPITLAGLQTVNGLALSAGDRVLVKDQADPIENGIYNANSSAWSRALDFNGTGDAVVGTIIGIADGTSVLGVLYRVQTIGIIGTDPIAFQDGPIEMTLTTIGGSGAGLGFQHSYTATANQAIDDGKNMISAGPITINDGVVVSIPDGSTWVIA